MIGTVFQIHVDYYGFFENKDGSDEYMVYGRDNAIELSELCDNSMNVSNVVTIDAFTGEVVFITGGIGF